MHQSSRASNASSNSSRLKPPHHLRNGSTCSAEKNNEGGVSCGRQRQGARERRASSSSGFHTVQTASGSSVKSFLRSNTTYNTAAAAGTAATAASPWTTSQLLTPRPPPLPQQQGRNASRLSVFAHSRKQSAAGAVPPLLLGFGSSVVSSPPAPGIRVHTAAATSQTSQQLSAPRCSVERAEALVVARNSHRLRDPQDAFLLGGSVKEAAAEEMKEEKARDAALALGLDGEVFKTLSPAARSRAMKMAERRRQLVSAGSRDGSGGSVRPGAGLSRKAADGSSVRRKQHDRSFLPEDLAAKEEEAKQKRLREEQREEHEKKKLSRLAVLVALQEELDQRMQQEGIDISAVTRIDVGRDGLGNLNLEAEERRLRQLLDDYRERQRRQRSERKRCASKSSRAPTAAAERPRPVKEDGVDEDGGAREGTAEEEEEGDEKEGGDVASASASASAVGSLFLDSFSTLSETIPSDARKGNSDDEDSDLKDESESEAEEETTTSTKERLEREVILYYAAMFARRTQATLVIQRAWRCSRARLALYNRQQVLYQFLYTQQKAAAMCIVGVLRARVRQRQRQEALVQQQEDERVRAAHERAVVKAVRMLETVIKEWLARRQEKARLLHLLGLSKDARLQRYGVAAVLVQRWWRVVPERRAYWQRRSVEVAEQRKREEEERRRRQAAISIQRRVRGILGRRYFVAYRVKRRQEREERQQRLQQCTDVVLLTLREFALRRQRLQRESEEAAFRKEEAAEAIQRSWKQALVRRHLQGAVEEARRLRTSATAIQHAWRRYYAGKELRYLRRLHDTMQRDRIEDEFRIYHAAVCLQRFARDVVLRQRYERLSRSTYGRQAFLALCSLQGVGRAFLTRRRLGARYHERRRYEAACRAREASLVSRSTELVEGILCDIRSLYISYQAAVAHEAEIAELRLLARNELDNDARVGVIQRASRRWMARRRRRHEEQQLQEATAHIIDAVVCLQLWWLRVRARRALAHKIHGREWAMRKRLEWEDVIVALQEEDERKDAEALVISHQQHRQEAASGSDRLPDGQLGRAGQWKDESALATAAAAVHTSNAAWMGLYDDDDDDDKDNDEEEEEGRYA